ncbi:hypothetical protein VTN49DRAFT_3762 [Thermomyces lanuginosus]|uniref:uncharacterized protein n=1 Tax=Thermomyces lanuginosus TaxID=5541 RepID=UPI0037438D4D
MKISINAAEPQERMAPSKVQTSSGTSSRALSSASAGQVISRNFSIPSRSHDRCDGRSRVEKGLPKANCWSISKDSPPDRPEPQWTSARKFSDHEWGHGLIASTGRNDPDDVLLPCVRAGDVSANEKNRLRKERWRKTDFPVGQKRLF